MLLPCSLSLDVTTELTLKPAVIGGTPGDRVDLTKVHTTRLLV